MSYTIEQLRSAYQAAKAAGAHEDAQQIWGLLVQKRTAQDTEQGQNNYDPSAGGGTLKVGLPGVGSIDTGVKTPEWVDRTLAGTGRGMTNVVRHAGNLVGAVSDQDIADAKSMDKPLMDTTAGKVGNFIGETAITAPLTMGVAGAVGRAGGAATRLVTNPIGRGVVEGATQGFVMGDPGRRGEGALMGGALGAVVPAVGMVGSKVMNGLKRTPEAQQLLDAGVDLTPGQMNPGGVMNALEEGWQSVPGVGQVISGARENARNTFQRAVAQEAAAPGSTVVQGEAADMLDQAYKSFAPLYDQAKGFPVRPEIMTTGQNIPLSQAFGQAARVPSVRATDQTRKGVQSWLSDMLTSLKKAGNSSDNLIDMRSQIRAAARVARSSGDAQEHMAAELLDHAEDAVTKALESQLPNDAIAALRTADGQYGLYKTVEAAVARAKDKPGGFTAADLAEAVAQTLGKGQAKGAYARGGGGPLRDLAQAGTATLNMRSPPTGARLAAIGLPTAAGVAAPAVGIPVGAGILGLVGTRTGRRLAAGATAPQQAAQALAGRYNAALPQTAQELLAEALRRASVTAALPQQ